MNKLQSDTQLVFSFIKTTNLTHFTEMIARLKKAHYLYHSLNPSLKQATKNMVSLVPFWTLVHFRSLCVDSDIGVTDKELCSQYLLQAQQIVYSQLQQIRSSYITEGQGHDIGLKISLQKHLIEDLGIFPLMSFQPLVTT